MIQAAIEAEEELSRARKAKDRLEMEKMLAANNDMKANRAERIAEELAVRGRGGECFVPNARSDVGSDQTAAFCN